MGKYSNLADRRVEAHYRAGDIQLSAIGTLVSDTGKSIFVEERFTQNGKQKTMRVEIPYEFIVRVAALDETSGSPGSAGQKKLVPSTGGKNNAPRTTLGRKA